MSEINGERVRILILTAKVRELTPVKDFLEKRNYSIAFESDVRAGVARVVGNRPDWLLVSIDFTPMVEKFVGLLRQSFSIDPIMFGDMFDRTTMSRLEQFKGRVLGAKLTGPSLQQKISQIIHELENTGVARHRLPPRATSGVRKSSFGDILVTGPKARPQESKTGLGQIIVAPQSIPISYEEEELQAADVEQFMVLLGEEGGTGGYTVVGSTREGANAVIQGLKEKVVSSFSADSVAATSLNDLRAKLVRQNLPGGRSRLACFVPAADPLPPYKVSPHDAGKLEVRLSDIPTEVALPCPIYVYFPANQKFVRLIKGDGSLTTSQQQRLLKAGLQVIAIAKEDQELFNLFYVREKLTQSTAA